MEAAQSAAGVVGPFLGGLISRYLGKDAPLIAVVGVYCFLFTFISWGYKKHVISSKTEDLKNEGSISGSKEVKKTM